MKQKCPNCSADAIYDEEYDSYLCIECREWTELICSDCDCCYCKNRPLHKFMDKIHDKIIKEMNE